jgi:hypothetical protein
MRSIFERKPASGGHTNTGTTHGARRLDDHWNLVQPFGGPAIAPEERGNGEYKAPQHDDKRSNFQSEAHNAYSQFLHESLGTLKSLMTQVEVLAAFTEDSGLEEKAVAAILAGMAEFDDEEAPEAGMDGLPEALPAGPPGGLDGGDDAAPVGDDEYDPDLNDDYAQDMDEDLEITLEMINRGEDS